VGEVCAIPLVDRSKRLTSLESVVWRIAARKGACILAFALAPVALRLALLPWIPPPVPMIHDEFSNLLAADTFASGRLTNPPHPYWIFFESFHILQQPTYMSKYPPLTGLILAAGQQVFGHPWAGVLLSMGLLCGALAWAMQNWLPPVWALAGTTIAVLKIGVLSYWAESYWGGTGAAIGGTLLIGIVPLMIRRPNFRNGLVAAIGIALLANSRPFEGLILTALCLGYVGFQIRGALVRAIALPLVVVMLPVGAWMAYYNFRVTGSALEMPYTAHERQYAVASDFPWQETKAAPVYHHAVMREFWTGWELTKKTFQREHFLLTRLPSFASVEEFFWGFPLFVLIAANIKAMARSRRTRPAFWLLIAFLAGLGLELEFLPHYAAPAAVLFYIVVAGALRSVRHWKPQRTFARRWGAPLTRVAVAGIAAWLAVAAFQPGHRYLYDKRDFAAQRARVLNFLDRIPGKQLVFVRYGPKHDIHHEWVYNRADIDAANIVWARSMGAGQDAKLMAYYPDRRVWLLEENGPEQLSSYGRSAGAVASR
jgi:hypothetical protein